MSWDDHIASLRFGGLITEAAICGFDGSVWAASESLKGIITAEQVKCLIGPSSAMTECGPTVGNIKCMFVKDDRDNEQSFCLHLKGNKNSGLQTVCVGKTSKAIVIGIAPPNASIAQRVFTTTKLLRDNKC
ncbi:profilin-2-like [Sebastes umbrosus]|uniref:profilin-2-like n=1 Tax=Sebastes umbrosus TaxID=72105 RepID=UPI00189F0E87|nr:profilin-2-like [Sebastes umbrosus]